MQLRIQAISAWAGTRAWLNRIERSGSMPQATRAAAISRTLARSSAGIVVDGDGVEIGEEEQAFGLVLHPHPAHDRAEIIAEVEVAGRLDAGDDAHHGSITAFFLRLSRINMSSLSIAPITQATAK